MSASAVEKPASANIELRNGAAWTRLSISLAEEFTGGSVVRLAAKASVALEPGDKLSSTYTNKNWFSGIASGAFYAFRTLKAQRRVVLVNCLAGHLGTEGIEVLAFAAARLVADLLQGELTLKELAGWKETSLNRK